jgi:hypothetical protein
MLREVLLALLGHTGSVVVDARSAGYEEEGIVVNKDFLYLDEAERVSCVYVYLFMSICENVCMRVLWLFVCA